MFFDKDRKKGKKLELNCCIVSTSPNKQYRVTIPYKMAKRLNLEKGSIIRFDYEEDIFEKKLIIKKIENKKIEYPNHPISSV